MQPGFQKEVSRVRRAQKIAKMVKKSGFGGFEKNLINLYVPFLLEYENTIGILPFCRNLVIEFYSKNTQTDQNEGFFKLQYLKNALSYEVEFLYPIRHSQKQQIYSNISNGCDQACLGMSKFMSNCESALSQE